MTRVALCLALVGCGRIAFTDRPDAADPGVVEISARGDHACARTGTGLVYCWGSNSHGQLGRGVAGGPGEQGLADVSNVARIWTGEGSTFALDHAGQLWGWGKNDNGELGLGTTTADEPTPKVVSVPGTVVELATGEYQTCVVVTNGDVYCWGGDNCGAVGDGQLVPAPNPTRVLDASFFTQPSLQSLAGCQIGDTETSTLVKQ